MAYPYFPGYTPYPPYQPNAFNPYQNQQQQMQNVQNNAQAYSPIATQSGIIWVSGAQEAQMYPIAPNNAVVLWEKSGHTLYLKQADATGKPTMTIYDLVERKQAASDGVSNEAEKKPTYATKEDLGAVVGLVNGFNELVSGVKADIDAMKEDLYGIAGKKKTVKKVDENDE